MNTPPDDSRAPIDAAWPPAWFGSGRAAQPDISERTDEILRAELGRSRA